MEKHDSKNNDEKSLHFRRLRGCDPGESFFRTIEQLLVEFISAMANVANLCRLCGTNTIGIVRHNIFEGEGLAKKFADKIADCLPVNVSIEDRLPKILCGECSYKLDLLSDFRDVCVKTETLLLSLIDGIKHEVCDVDAEEEEVKGEVVQRRSSRRTSQKRALEEIEESEKEASEDDFCMDDGGDRDDDDEDEEFVVKTPAKKRSRKSGEPKKPELQEKKKPSQGKSDEIKNPSTEKPAKTNEFLAPEFVSLAEPKVETVHEYNVSAKGNFDCDQCGAKFSNQGFWQSHCSRPHQHLCNQCGKLRISRTAEHLCRHQCEKCKIYIDGKDAFTVHQVKCYIRSFTCDLCGFVAYRRQKITNHIKIAHFLKMDEEYKFKSCWCEICKRKFSTSFALQQHKLRKHEGVLMCSVCFKRFETKEERRKHVQETHSKEKVSFECPECGKKLCSKFSVKLHVDNIHRKLRPHLCQVCGSSFITAGHLKLHVMMHTGEKNHVCKDCGHAFARIENLTQHRRIHTNSRPFLCDFCPRSFTQQSSLKCHRRIHTGETPYRCQLCPQSFRTKQQLDQHVKFHPAV